MKRMSPAQFAAAEKAVIEITGKHAPRRGLDDLRQDVWLRVLRDYERYDAERYPVFGKWLFSVVFRAMLDHRKSVFRSHGGMVGNGPRARYNVKLRPDVIGGVEWYDDARVSLPQTETERKDFRRYLIRLLRRLDKGHRVILLQLLRGRSQKEIAACLGVSPAAVNTRLKKTIYPKVRAIFAEASYAC